MKRILIAAVMLVAIVGICARAGTEAGKREIQFQGSLTLSTNSEDDDKNTSAMGAVVLSYFLTPQFSIGLSTTLMASLQQPESGDETKSTVMFFMGRADLYLTDGATTVVPYIGAQAGGVNYTVDSGHGETDTSTTVAYGGHGGLKIFPTENTSWNVEGNITMYKPEGADGSREITLTQSALLLGFSYYF